MSRPTGCRKAAWIGLALAGAACVWSGPVRAEEDGASARIAALNYDVYVGGLHVFAFEVEMVLQRDRYRIAGAGETRGMVGWLYPWTMNLAAEGLDRDGRVSPQHYTAQTQWRDRPRKLDLRFVEEGRYELEQAPPPEPDPDIEGGLPDSLPPEIADPLSFALAAARALEKSGSCDQTVPVFDGQRRFDAVVKHLGAAVLQPNAYSMYQGAAVRCSLEIRRISGFRKSLKTRVPDSAGPPTLWMATIRPDLPPLPVRYEGEIALGKMIVHLTGATFRDSAVD